MHSCLWADALVYRDQPRILLQERHTGSVHALPWKCAQHHTRFRPIDQAYVVNTLFEQLFICSFPSVALRVYRLIFATSATIWWRRPSFMSPISHGERDSAPRILRGSSSRWSAQWWVSGHLFGSMHSPFAGQLNKVYATARDSGTCDSLSCWPLGHG